MKPETKYKGSIKLSAIGDALGWITEFEKSEEALIKKYGTSRIDKFYSWRKKVGGRFYGYVDSIEAGSYSDDTQLLLSVARSIKKGGEVDNDYFAKIELPAWLEYARGGGRTVKAAAEKIQRKSVKWYNNFYTFKVNGENFDYRNAGANGAAMRVLPIALANLGNVEKIKAEIFSNSIITHGHPRAILGAMLYGYAINQIIIYKPENFNWENYLIQIGLDFPEKFDLNFINEPALKDWLDEWNKVSNFQDTYFKTILETQNYLRIVYQSIKHDSNIVETLQKIGCFNPNTKGSGVSTVVAGIYLATKFNTKPLDAIEEAVNLLGTDTDTIAAFTGGLIGALHGHNIIPDKWKKVQDNTYLDQMAEKLLAISEDNYLEDKTHNYVSNNIINQIAKDNLMEEEKIKLIPLGEGTIISIDRQPTLTKGKYNLLVDIIFESGQSIIFSKLFSNLNLLNDKTDFDELLELAEKKLKSEALESFREYIANKKISKKEIMLLKNIVENEK